ncbi:MAG: glycosyl hydrolase, partial [Candidatus Gottesmanbacteria bacterium]|nr:glycosyl hydrolase [Candidatus Gottesmanbacteria bacterium]
WKMKKILLLILMAGVILFGKPSSVFAAIIPDQRFGYGGSYQIAHDLNIPWFYNWGVNTAPHPGQKTFFLVGKNECIKVDLSTLESQGLKDDEDRNLYLRLDTVLKKFEGKVLTNGVGNADYNGSAVCNHIDNARKTFLQIAATLANFYPGSYYQIANEPDWSPYFTPEDYAEYYNIFYTQIKKYDSSAKVMTGGLLSIDPIIYNKSDYLGYDPNNHYKWVDDFRNSYKNKFGSFPKVDVWNIHTYSWFDWNLTKNMIVDFRDVFLTRIGEAKAPVWISELGIMAMEGAVVHPGVPCVTHGCLSAADQMTEWNMIANDYMKPLFTWLKSNDYVQKWFWYYAGETSAWTHGLNYVGDTYKLPNGEYPPIGTMYKQLAEEDAEKIPNCSITSGPATLVLGETANYAVSFSSTQGNLGTRLNLGQNGVFKEDIKGTVSYQSNTAATGTFSWKPTSTGTFDIFCRAWNDAVAECRGNPAYVDQLPRYECAGPNAYMTVKVVPYFPSDLNNDGKVDSSDFNKMVADFGKTGSPNFIPADINGDGKIDLFDYTILVGNFGK